MCSHPLSSRCPFCFLVPMAQTPIWKGPNSNSNCSCKINFPVFHELVSGTYRVSSIVQSSTNWYSEHTRYQVAGWTWAVFIAEQRSCILQRAENWIQPEMCFLQSYILLYNHLYSYIHIYSHQVTIPNGPRSWSSTRASSSIYWLMTEQRCAKYSSIAV